MRNLKRALSLALASVMLLGMMVVGTSALSYGDVDSADNVEAIDLLQAISVMSGDDKGNFNPDQVVTRAEMAVIICNVLYGKNLNVGQFVGADVFTDVPVWAQGYVNLAASLGIVAGVGDGKFAPNEPVTTAQAALMLCRALGYFQTDAEFANGWMLAATERGTKIGLYENLTGLSATAGLKRNDVAQMVFNALTETTPVVYNEIFGYYTVGGTLTNGVQTGDQAPTLTLAYKTFDVTTSPKTSHGETGHVWVNRYSSKVLTDFYMTDSSLAVSTNGTEISKLTTKSDSKFVVELDTTNSAGTWTQLKFYLNGTQLRVLTNGASCTAGEVYVNATSLTAPKIQVAASTTTNHSTDPEYAKKGAIVTFLDQKESDGTYDGKAEVVTIVEKSVATLSRNVETSTSGSVTSLKAAIGTGMNAIPASTNVEYVHGYEGLKKDDVVLYYALANDSNGDTQYYIEKIEPVVVTFNSVNLSNGKVTTSNGTYEQSGLVANVDGTNSLATVASSNLNKDAKVYADSYGYVVKVADVEVTDNYLVVLGATYDAVNGMTVKAIDETGKVFTTKVTKVGTSEPTALGDVTAYSVVYKYEVTEKGYELTAYTTGSTTGEQYLKSYTGGTNATLNKNEAAVVLDTAGSQITAYANDKTIFIVENTTANTRTVYTGIKNVPSITADAANVYSMVYEYGTSNIAKYVYVKAAGAKIDGAVSTSDKIFITSKNAVETKIGDTTYYTYDAVVNGAVTTVTATAAGKSSIDTALSTSSSTYTIGVVTVSGRDGDYITAVTSVAGAYTGSGNTLKAANITKISDGTIIASAAIPGTASKTVMQYDANTQVVIRDKDGNVDVNASVDSIDVANDFVIVVPTSDNANLADVIYVVQK